MASYKEIISELLLKTNREGIQEVIENLEKEGFYTAPCSRKFHGNYAGGLVEHSYNVYKQMVYQKKVQVKINPELEEKLPDESIIISALLHDVCKMDNYDLIDKWRKDSNNKWESYKGYDYSDDSEPLGHGEKSVIKLLVWGLKLTPDEIAAIRWHMGAFDRSDYGDSKRGLDKAFDKYPLALLLHVSDMLASRFNDKKKE